MTPPRRYVKIGVIAFVPPKVMEWDKANLEGKVVVKDIIETAEKFVPKMKQEGADSSSRSSLRLR